MKRKGKVSRCFTNEFPHDGGANKAKVINKGRASGKLTCKRENIINYTINAGGLGKERGIQ